MAKKIIAWLLVVVMTASICVAGTLAYLTDRDSEANVFTAGDVNIGLDEDFIDNSTLLPGVEVNKDVQIENNGPNEAYVWYTYAVPAALDAYLEVAFAENSAWKAPIEVGEKSVGDVAYKYYAVLHNAPIAAGVVTEQSMDAVTLFSGVDVAPNGDLYVVENGVTTPLNWNIDDDHIIYVDAYAIQADGFDSVVAAYNAFQAQWGGDAALPEVNAIKANTPELMEAVLADPELAPGSVIDGEGVTIYVSNNEQYNFRGDITLQNVNYITQSRGGEYMIVNSGEGKVVFEDCTFTREELGMLVFAGADANASDIEFNNCIFNGPVAPNMVAKADGNTVFNNCQFKIGTAFMKQGWVNCMGGTHTFIGCTFDYTGGSTNGSNQYVRYNAVNSYSERYSTAVILEGCTFINCGTQRYGSNSTLTVK